MKVISVINQKGGVGKTTTTYNIATLLAKKNYKVLMIDHDGQASLTLACALNPIDLDLTMSNVYLENSELMDAALETDVDNLHIIPSNIKLTSAETALINAFARETILKNKLKKIADKYDYVIIDNPPHLGLLTINSLVASDYLIVPCATNPMSTYALDDLFSTVDTVQSINTNLKVLGIVATMYNKVTKIDNAELDYLKDNYTVLGVIKSSIEASKGLADGLPAVITSPKSELSKQYIETVENILNIMEDK